MKERIQRHNDGEILDDLFHPLLENSKGVEPDISMEDRIAEVEQNGNEVFGYLPTRSLQYSWLSQVSPQFADRISEQSVQQPTARPSPSP